MRLPLLLLLWPLLALAADDLPLGEIRLPPGFAIELYARVPNARQMALGKRTLFVGSMAAGQVHALPLRDGRPGAPVVVASGLELPVGVAFRDGDLYVSAVSRILRLRDIEARLDRPPAPEVVHAVYPAERHHGWKFIAFGPDGRLYVPVGAPCNICAADPERYAVITRLDAASGRVETVARGVRNTVGFDWHPRTGELWFTDNGRDWMGDDAPPDELNRLDRPGRHFGYPHCHGARLADAEFGGRPCAERSFPPPIGTPSSSPSTAPGTAAARPATGSWWRAWTATGWWTTRPSPAAGCAAKRSGAARPTCWRCPTAACW